MNQKTPVSYQTNLNIGDLVWMGAWDHTFEHPYCIIIDCERKGLHGEAWLMFVIEGQVSYWVHSSSINHWGFEKLFTILAKLNDQK